MVNDIIRSYCNERGFFVDANFQEVHIDEKFFWGLSVGLNSSLTNLFANILGRTNFGGGLLKIQTYEVADIFVVNPVLMDSKKCQQIILNSKKEKDYKKELSPCDFLVQKTLNLSDNEQNDLLETLGKLIQDRNSRAGR